jgi:hypothetical protein
MVQIYIISHKYYRKNISSFSKNIDLYFIEPRNRKTASNVLFSGGDVNNTKAETLILWSDQDKFNIPDQFRHLYSSNIKCIYNYNKIIIVISKKGSLVQCPYIKNELVDKAAYNHLLEQIDKQYVLHIILNSLYKSLRSRDYIYLKPNNVCNTAYAELLSYICEQYDLPTIIYDDISHYLLRLCILD